MSANDVSRKMISLFSKEVFFYFVIALFCFQAAWIALTSHYPMAFDEDFHLGLIRLYANHASPFWASQPAGADVYGAVVRDPSFFYHWFMSWPYRLFDGFGLSQSVQVLLFRFIDIGLFAYALIIYRSLMLKTGASKAIVNLCLLAFVLIPVVPLLAAQLNYDNFFLLLTAAVILMTLKFVQSFGPKHCLDLKAGILLAALMMIASITKYAFLPVVLAVSLYVFYSALKSYESPRALISDIKVGWSSITAMTKLWIVALLVVAAVPFIQRYGVNLYTYHNPVPDCEKVLNIERCSEYAPWRRDYNYKQTKSTMDTTTSPLVFSADWFYGMWLRNFFAVAGPDQHYQTRGPMAVPALAAILWGSLGLLALAWKYTTVLKYYDRKTIKFYVLVSSTYIAFLWLNGYMDFLSTGRPVAINGRYLYPVLPLIFILFALGINLALAGQRVIKVALAVAAIFTLVWGGGALTYVLRSEDSWYWSLSAIKDVNHAVKDSLGPVTPGYRKPTQFMHNN